MAKVWKVLIRPGVYRAPQGRLEATATRCRRWAAGIRAMRAAGIRVPVCWGHQPGAIPGEDADKATRQFLLSKYNAGYVEDARVDPRSGSLEALLDVPGAESDPEGNLLTEAAMPGGNRVKCAIKEVSAAIRDWRDGTGKEWPDSIIHVALVTLPVMAGQKGFGVEGAGGANQPGGAGEVYLSLSDLLYTMGTDKGTDMPDMLDDAPGAALLGDDSRNGRVSRTLGVLKRFGIHLPPDTNDGNLCERIDLIGNALIQAGVAPGDKAGAAGDGGEPDGDEALEMEDDPLGDEMGEEGGLDDMGDDLGEEGLGDEGLDDLGDEEMGDDLGEEGGGEEGGLLDDLGGEGDDEGDEEAEMADDDLGDEEEGDEAVVSGDSDAMPGDEEEDEDAEEEPRPVMMGGTGGKGGATLRTPMEKALAKRLVAETRQKRLKRLEKLKLPRHRAQEMRKKILASPVRLAKTRTGVEPVKEVVDYELSTIEGMVRDGMVKRGGGGARRAQRPDVGDDDPAMARFIEEQAARVNGTRASGPKRRKK